MLSTVVLSNENQTCRDWEAPTSTGGGEDVTYHSLLTIQHKILFQRLSGFDNKQQINDFCWKKKGIPHSHQLQIQNSQKKEKNNTSQMRLGSVFKMRTSIINTATTEQMGYIIFSFFVYTKSTNQSLVDKDMLLPPDSIQNTSPDVIFYTLFAYRAIQ